MESCVDRRFPLYQHSFPFSDDLIISSKLPFIASSLSIHSYMLIVPNTHILMGHAVAQCLRHCATNRKLAGSIPDGIIGIFHWHNPSGRTMALGSTQPLTEMNTRNISWSKGGRCVGLTILPPTCADCLKIWEPRPPVTLRDCQGL
jgi:hypothetical protein